MNKWKIINPEVYAATTEIVHFNANDIQFLKENVLNCEKKRIRICAHQSSTDLLHEMLIVINKQSYVRPHKHVNKGESFHIIEGLVDIIIFHENGEIKQVIPMGDHASGKNFFYRLSNFYFHTLLIKSDFVVFHETTNGPFTKDDTIFAPWSPAENDNVQIEHYLKKLQHNLKLNFI